MTDKKPAKKSWHDDLPFPKQWLFYVAVKIIVLVTIVYIILRWQGML